jgi:hypothetical protein
MAQRLRAWRQRRKEGLATTPRLMKTALIGYKRHWWQYLKITGIVAVPVAIISGLASSSEPSISAYINMSTMIMNVALIWAIIQHRDRQEPTLRVAYYEGTTKLVQFILTSLLLVVMALPLIIGISIYVLGTTGSAGVSTGQERIIILGLSLLISIPSILMLTRSAFSTYLIFHPGVTPLQAIRQSRALVKDRFFAVISRLLLMGALSIVVFVGLILGVVLVQGNSNNWTLAGMQLLVNLILMPILHLYLLNLAWSLKGERGTV